MKFFSWLMDRPEAGERPEDALDDAVSRALWESLPCGVLFVDRDLCIRSANPAAGSMFGWSVEELIGAPLDAILPSRESELHGRPERVRSHTGELLAEEWSVEGQHREGSLFPVKVIPPATRSDGVWLLRDVTEDHRTLRRMVESRERLTEARDRAEQEARDASLYLGRVFEALRQPHDDLIERADGLLGHANGSHRQALVELRDTAKLVRHLLDDVISLSKVNAGRLLVEDGVFPLEPAVRAAVAATLQTVPRVEITLGIDPSVGMVKGSEVHVRRILQNLLIHSSGASTGGHITLVAGRLEGEQQVYVDIVVERPEAREDGLHPPVLLATSLARLVGGQLTTSDDGHHFSLRLRAARRHEVSHPPMLMPTGTETPILGEAPSAVALVVSDPSTRGRVADLLAASGWVVRAHEGGGDPTSLVGPHTVAVVHSLEDQGLVEGLASSGTLRELPLVRFTPSVSRWEEDLLQDVARAAIGHALADGLDVLDQLGA